MTRRTRIDGLEIFLTIVVIFFGSFIVSIFGVISFSEEVDWYRNQGFKVEELGYKEFIASFDEDISILEHNISRVGVREQSEYIYSRYGEIAVYYEVDNKIVFFLAHRMPKTRSVMIFVWNGSYP